MREAPTRNWVPEECLFIYDNVDDAISIIQSVTEDQIRNKAAELSAYIRSFYSPKAIYKSILVRL